MSVRSDSQSVTVESEATQTTVTVDTDPVRAGEEATLTATVTPADAAGTVTFTVGEHTQTVDVENGTASTIHTFEAAGEHDVVAEFTPADPDRYAGSSDTLELVVDGADPDATTVTAEPLTVEPGEDATLVVDVRPADAAGQVRFTIDDDTVTAPVEDGTATLAQLPSQPGEYTVLIEFLPADPDAYAPSSATTTITVTDDDPEPQEPSDPGTGSLTGVGLVAVIGSMIAGSGSLGSLGSVGS